MMQLKLRRSFVQATTDTACLSFRL